MDAYHSLAISYDRLTNDVDYKATVDFYEQILEREKLSPRTAVDLACGTGSVALLLSRKGIHVTGVDISEEMLGGSLYSAGIPDPDLMIRPGGELRLSNFLLWQNAYTEFYFTDTLWPDMDEAELDRAIAAYQGRKRRFGGI